MSVCGAAGARRSGAGSRVRRDERPNRGWRDLSGTMVRAQWSLIVRPVAQRDAVARRRGSGIAQSGNEP